MKSGGSSPRYNVENVVVTTQLAKNFNLIEINKRLDGAVYEPGKFPALRLKKHSVGFLLYSSGSIVCSGSKSPDEARQKIELLRGELKKCGVDTNQPEVMIRNIVASVDLGKELKLHELAYLMEDSEYNPEYFPGMKIRKGNTRILVFRTGKAIIPGLKSMDEVGKTVNWLKNRLDSMQVEIDKIKD